MGDESLDLQQEPVAERERRQHGLGVIEDAAHALPAAYRGRPVGSGANPVSFSFYATKNLTTGEGGMLTGDPEFLQRARVVSLPSFELFNQQPQTYQDQVLPPNVMARVAVEAGIRQCWDRYLGMQGEFVGLDRFGASAPYTIAFAKLGLTVERVVEAARAAIARAK